MSATKRTVLITGASGGIGAELARVMAHDGWDLVLVARGVGALEELAAELEKEHSTRARVIALDLEETEAPLTLFERLRAEGVVLDALVNNAGFGAVGPFVDSDPEVQLGMLRVNVLALTALTRLFLPGLVERPRGYVLNVASTAAFQPGPLMAVYYASKAYVLSFSEALADELRGSRATVTALCPGPTATGFAATAGTSRSRLFRSRPPADARKVAEYGYRAMLRGRRVAVEGWINKLLAQSIRISPRRLVTVVTRKMQENA